MSRKHIVLTDEFATGVARGAIGGVILGSNAWPSVPVDIQSRLSFWSSDCSEQRKCGLPAVNLADE
jgi:hypothetical protein